MWGGEHGKGMFPLHWGGLCGTAPLLNFFLLNFHVLVYSYLSNNPTYANSVFIRTSNERGKSPKRSVYDICLYVTVKL